jgi:serine protease Do
MKAKFLPAIFTAGFMMFTLSGFSQQWQPQHRSNEEIVISRNPSDSGKTIIEIDSNTVTINGEPLAEYKGDVKVFKRNFMGGNGNNFFSPGPQGFMFHQNTGNAFLGVITAKTDGGAVINNVLDNSSAKKAGLKKGDIITKVNDKEITSPDDLRNAIREFKPGDEVHINYLRDDKKKSVTLELGKTPANVQSFGGLNEDLLNQFKNGDNFNFRMLPMPRGDFNFNFNDNRPRLGLQIQDTEDSNGVKIQSVVPGSPAGKAGLKEGDIITEINGEKVKDVDKVMSEIQNADNKSDYKIKVLRDKKEMNFEVSVHRPLKTTNI